MSKASQFGLASITSLVRAARERRATERVHAALDTIPSRVMPDDSSGELLSGLNDVIVMSVGAGKEHAIVRIAAGPAGRSSIRDHARGLSEIHADPRCQETAALVPWVRDGGPDGSWLTESAAVGVTGADLAGERVLRLRSIHAGLEALALLHRSTSEQVTVDDGRFSEWVEEPLTRIAAVTTDPRSLAGLSALRQFMEGAFLHRPVTEARLHGDASPENFLYSTDGRRVTGILDWECSTTGLPEVDATHFILAHRLQGSRRELGSHVVSLLHHGFSPTERQYLGDTWPVNDHIDRRALILVAWLAHVGSNLRKADRYSTSRWWLHHNVDRVLREIPALLADEDGQRSVRRANRVTAAGVSAAALAWLVGCWNIKPAHMSDLGLLSILRPAAYLGLALALGTFALEVSRTKPNTRRLAAPLIAFVAMIHGTPAVLYGSVRYSWAWKHLGIIDFIHRHGAVDPHQPALTVYHNWPGFFALWSALTDLFGLGTAQAVARWWPLIANLAIIPVLLFVYSALTANRRVQWTGVLIFLVANWVGQDYFSPQSMAYLYYLTLIGILLHRFRRGVVPTEPSRRWSAGIGMALLVVLAAGISTSHQVTPFVLAVSVGALVLLRQIRTTWLWLTVLAINLCWALTAAWPFTSVSATSLAKSVGDPVQNASQNLVNQSRLSANQVLVSNMGRLAVAIVVLAAGLAVLMQIIRREVNWPALILLGSPGVLVLANSFDGEIVFRAYLFALPFAAWFVADGVWSGWRRAAAGEHKHVVRSAAIWGLSMLLLVGFLFGYYGKEQWSYFSKHEIAASNLILSQAPPHSLLVTINSSYPAQWKNYENLVYVPIAIEPPDSRAALLADPAKVLARWLSGYRHGYILLSHAQAAEVNALQAIPRGSVERIEAALLGSPKFKALYRTPEATVFVLASGTGST